ncbi:MAG: hypothetical protein AVDCRST_MAG55-835 [uncultured Rubrobacteraceae bacterium]|uniref:Uncharacterized protein n=1 Tax=uncultured Rubrobacteraceae bacterium TaxID=349277 RepID=A0A6J4P200_9ACTN|nr:MAG: hypothetical protein AVDCRST_MAG55-835 [uncultured Rubrobacteraceae bacterium]
MVEMAIQPSGSRVGPCPTPYPVSFFNMKSPRRSSGAPKT